MKSFHVLLTGIALVGFSTLAHAAEYVEEGRFGVEGLITTDSFHAGLVRETDTYEIAVDLDGSITNASEDQKTGDMGVDLRVGKRWNIGSFNYFSAGIDWSNSLFGHDGGVSTSGTYFIAPYIGLQRHFSGTNLMLTLYVLPYSYNHLVQDSVATNSHRFFQQGGFGIAYLF